MSKIIFQKKSGLSYHGDSLKLIKSNKFRKKYMGKINLIFTSPPFNLIYKKKYGNRDGILKQYAKNGELLREVNFKNGVEI